MIEKNIIEVKSGICGNIENVFLSQGEEARGLVVLFPGNEYRCDTTLLHYARNVSLQQGYDVLCLNYSHHVTNMPFDRSKIDEVIRDSHSAVKKVLGSRRYDKTVFISKSLGSVVAGEVAKIVGYMNVFHIFLTPIPKAIPQIISSHGMVIVGTCDKLFLQEHIDTVSPYVNVCMQVIEGANHGLEIPQDFETSLEILNKVAKLIRDFIMISHA
jgi:hypothetical protein